MSATPAERGLSMPAEWAPHERTLMAWPCRTSLWANRFDAAKAEYAGVANAIAAFEPVTMAVNGPREADEVRAACSENVEPLELPTNDSWMRDHGPVFVMSADRRERVGVHFRFNAWGGKFAPFDRDERSGGVLASRYGDEVVAAPIVLEGGSIAVDGAGVLLTTEQCLLHPGRNPELGREEISGHLHELLGVERVIWLGKGLVEDRDTDGHVDLIAAFIGAGRPLMQSVDAKNVNHEALARNQEIAAAAGLDVVDFPVLAYATVEDEPVVCSYLNFYVGEGFCVVPTFGQPTKDGEALTRIAEALPAHEVVGVPALTVAWGGGGPHCITQQVPAKA
ncbi:MAG: agmatine deiminase family protein [Baekduia sp.]